MNSPTLELSIAIILTSFFKFSSGTLSESFRQFLRQQYGDAVEREMSREDVGGGGSFGGGNHNPETQTKWAIFEKFKEYLRHKFRHRPVILVHGITNNAGNFGAIQQYFRTHGYDDSEVYGTTYGDSGKTSILFVSMHCHYAKVIRMFVEVVASYTQSKVNIIAYSMGSPVARKALMGGVCMDTGEEIGPPLTKFVHTFVGVAGANFGSFLCVFPFGSCNLVNGMGCGSRFLNDINSKSRYEGDYIYTIYSTGDDKVGYIACGRIASQIVGQDEDFKSGMNHDQVMFNTARLQYNLITYNHS